MYKFYSDNKITLEIVKTAFYRSFSRLSSITSNFHFFISPNEIECEKIKSLLDQNTKVVVFGSLSNDIASYLGLKVIEDVSFKCQKSMVCLDQDKSFNSSQYYVQYEEYELLKDINTTKRYFTRFDFMDEWNNLGYGRIGIEDDIWSINQVVKNKSAASLAQVYDSNGAVSEYVTLKDFENSSILFVNREIGLIDSLEWSIVEEFLARYRIEDLPCLPLILDVPYECTAVVSARLDCDQSVINTKPLVDLYKSFDINLSLAIATGINITEEEVEYLNNYYDNGGALLSHTVNHFFDWGDCYDTVLNEAKVSKRWLEENVKNLKTLEYAVSPFHTNKPYSIEALADTGYKGFISGIIHNDPEYLLGVSGQVPFTRKNIISHSQQCMLHGDCYHRNNKNLDIYKESFKAHYKSGKMFGYLDHPFGNYDYGWENEKERLGVHKEFIEYINSFEDVKWMTSVEVLQFVYDKSHVEIEIDENDKLTLDRKSHESSEQIAVEYKGETYVC